MTLVHPRTWSVKTYLFRQNQPSRHLLTSIALAASAAVDTKKGGIFDIHAMDDYDEPWLSDTDHRLEQRVQERNVPWYAVRNCLARLPETSCITGQGKECTTEQA